MISKLQLYERILHGESKDIIMVTSSSSEDMNENIAALYGVNNQHSYTVLGVLSADFNG